ITRKHWIGFESRLHKASPLRKATWAGCMSMAWELRQTMIMQSSGIARRPTKEMKVRRKIFNASGYRINPSDAPYIDHECRAIVSSPQFAIFADHASFQGER